MTIGAKAVLERGSMKSEKSRRPGTEPWVVPALKQWVEEEEAIKENYQ